MSTVPTLEERFVGSLLGLALGDALGAKHEGGILGGILWVLVGGTRGEKLWWTDDTQMAVGLAESLVECGGLDPDRLARRWADGYETWRGYGHGARKLLARVRQGEDWRSANRSVFPDGSLGNGAAMRAAPLGLFYYADPETLARAAEVAASITHAHPLGVEGGVLIARATALALAEDFEPGAFLAALLAGCRREEFRKRLELARVWLGESPDLRAVSRGLGTAVTAHESAVTAVYAFCRHRTDFMELVKFVVALGGDTDTIGAMAGGIFGARNGVAALPADLLARLEARERIESVARALCASSEAPGHGRSSERAR
ncbi:MAG: ADP-ribosylglycohydrolase family protein [Planctomycetes bacterium]|nr:ADP-ribosylglycohydrolase family protein [Planctomycetota bacterium]